MSNIPFVFWAMEFQEKIVLRFTDLYLGTYMTESSLHTYVIQMSSFGFEMPSSNPVLSYEQLSRRLRPMFLG